MDSSAGVSVLISSITTGVGAFVQKQYADLNSHLAGSPRTSVPAVSPDNLEIGTYRQPKKLNIVITLLQASPAKNRASSSAFRSTTTSSARKPVPHATGPNRFLPSARAQDLLYFNYDNPGGKIH
jgi:hypothetical protein